MSIASLFLGVVLATLYGALFHLWRGGSAGRLVFYLGLSWVGFIIGHLVGVFTHAEFDKIGELHLGLSSFGSIIFIGLGYWLSLSGDDHKRSK